MIRTKPDPAFPPTPRRRKVARNASSNHSRRLCRSRNDRLVGVAEPRHTHSNLREIENLNPTLLREIDNFFINYHQQYGRKFKVLGHCRPKEAMKMVKKAVTRKSAA